MELVDALVAQLGVTTRQAEGCAGLLLAHAQAKLTLDQFTQIADAIPAVSDLIAKAPRPPKQTDSAVRALWHRWFSGWGRLAPHREALERLALDPTAVGKIVAAMIDHLNQQDALDAELLLTETLG